MSESQPENRSEKLLNFFEKLTANRIEERGSVKILLCGPPGSGKTRTALTAPGPVLVHSFDPNGTNILYSKGAKQKFNREDIYIDTRFEGDAQDKAIAFDLWEQEIQRMLRDELFDGIATYYLDSLSFWSDALLHKIYLNLKQKGQLTDIGSLRKSDWGLFLRNALNAMRLIKSIPCNVIITSHLQLITDEVTGKITAVPLIYGQASVKIPAMFTEVWVMKLINKGKETERKFLVTSTEKYQAKTAIGAEGILPTLVEPNVREVLKLCGFPYEDIK